MFTSACDTEYPFKATVVVELIWILAIGKMVSGHSCGDGNTTEGGNFGNVLI
jgi:hypothetical protein